MSPEFASKKVVVLGVSSDSTEDNKKFAEKYCFDFKLLSDKQKSVITDYKAGTTESTYASRIAYLIDEQGHIVKSYEDIDVSGFAQTVLTDLNC